jgi:hypothetical protein
MFLTFLFWKSEAGSEIRRDAALVDSGKWAKEEREIVQYVRAAEKWEFTATTACNVSVTPLEEPTERSFLLIDVVRQSYRKYTQLDTASGREIYGA